MNITRFCIGIVIAIQLSTTSHAFQIVAASGPLKTTQQLLTERGVSLDSHSLLIALSASDEATRSLAAQELADLHNTDAAPLIEEAFRTSRSSLAHFNLAQALVQLEPTTGKTLIAKICKNRLESGAMRLESIRILWNLGARDCDQFLPDIAVGAEDPQVKISALDMLRNHHAEGEKSDVPLEVEKILIGDDNAGVRSAAASALAARRDKAALAILRKRLIIEKDPDVREQLKQLCSVSIRSSRAATD